MIRLSNICIYTYLYVFLFFSCQNKLRPNSFSVVKIDCMAVVRRYQDYWKLDSLGHNGFRALLCEQVIKACDFKHQKWSELLALLGKPNRTFEIGKETHYRYFLDGDLQGPGIYNLEILVVDGLVTKFDAVLSDG